MRATHLPTLLHKFPLAEELHFLFTVCAGLDDNVNVISYQNIFLFQSANLLTVSHLATVFCTKPVPAKPLHCVIYA